MERFTALDSWRGICACLVALFHFQANSHLHGLSFLDNAYLFVDFFFVLSGFVIAANYQQRLRDGFGLGRFMLLRFGRLYPLHLFMLVCYLAFETVQLAIPQLGAMGTTAPFSAPTQSADTVLANLLLLHGLGLFDFLTWNGPSWSISTEFYSYLLFAVVLLLLGKRIWIAVGATLLAGPLAIIWLNDGNMNTTYDYGLIRCLAGFAAGVACWHLYDHGRATILQLRHRRFTALVAEVLAVGLVILFVSMAGKDWISVLAPFVFALTLLVFSAEAGPVSRLLLKRPLVFLGGLSYSIYMVHVFVQARLLNLGQFAERWSDIRLFTQETAKDETATSFGITQWQGDLASVVMLLIVIAVSAVTYRLVEEPGRRWFRRLADRTRKTSAAGSEGRALSSG